ncbi:hypothetical protein HPC63_12320, partial [Treponema phagedenis]|nr:hypothetical protein [Treponema phagedenis]
VAGPNAFGFQLEQAKLNAQSFAIKLGQELIPSLQALLSPVFKLAEWLKNLNEEQLRLIISTGKVLITFTAVTAGAFGLVKRIIAVQRGLKAMDTAFKVIGSSNPFMLAIAGAAAAVIAIKEVCNWIDYAADKQRQYRLATIEANTATMVQAQRINELAKAYETLNQKEKLNKQDALRMKEIAKEINAITGQSLIMISQSTGKARIDVEASIEAAHKLAERKQADLEHNKKVLNQLEAAEQELTERVKEYGESTAWAIEETLEKFTLLPDSLKTVTNAKDGLRKTREEIAKLKIDITETERGIAALRDYSKESFVPELEPEKQWHQLMKQAKEKKKMKKHKRNGLLI